MGRPEQPVDYTSPSRGMLANLLRKERESAKLSYRELAVRTGRPRSTLQYAATGKNIPSMEIVRDWLDACRSPVSTHKHATSLWHKARRDERGGRVKITVSAINTPDQLADGMKNLHVNYGAPQYWRMRQRTGSYALSESTICRILTRKMLPKDEKQMEAFLVGCGVPKEEQSEWIDAWRRSSGKISMQNGVDPVEIQAFVESLVRSVSFEGSKYFKHQLRERISCALDKPKDYAIKIERLKTGIG